MRTILPLLVIWQIGTQLNGQVSPNYASVTVVSGTADACDPKPSAKRAGMGDSPAPGGYLCSVGVQIPPVDAGTPYKDFNFGGEGVVATPPGFVHGYSFPSPMSAHNKYLAITDNNGNHYAVDRTQPGFVKYSAPSPNAAPMWDPNDDETYYTLWQSQIQKHDVKSGSIVILQDYAPRMTQIQAGGSTQQSLDGWFTFWSPPEHQFCLYDLTTNQTYCADYMAPNVIAKVGFNFIDFSLATNYDQVTKKRYAVMVAAPALAVFSVDYSTKSLRFEFRGPEFTWADGFNGTNGNQDGICDPGENCLGAPHLTITSIAGKVYFAFDMPSENPCGREISYLPFSAGLKMASARTRILPTAYCSSGYEWPDGHIGCSAVTGACVLSFYTSGNGPHGNQIMVVKDPKRIIKLTFTHSTKFPQDDYWYSARGALSPDGKYLIFDSNFGEPNRSRVVVVKIPQ